MDVRPQLVEVAVAVEDDLAGERAEEHAAERVDVGAPVDVAAAGLLGRHEVGGAHRHGLVHRDVKPGNILIERDENGERVFLTDFGVTKQRAAGEELTRTGSAVGTADFMSPEQGARG